MATARRHCAPFCAVVVLSCGTVAAFSNVKRINTPERVCVRTSNCSGDCSSSCYNMNHTDFEPRGHPNFGCAHKAEPHGPKPASRIQGVYSSECPSWFCNGHLHDCRAHRQEVRKSHMLNTTGVGEQQENSNQRAEGAASWIAHVFQKNSVLPWSQWSLKVAGQPRLCRSGAARGYSANDGLPSNQDGCGVEAAGKPGFPDGCPKKKASSQTEKLRCSFGHLRPNPCEYHWPSKPDEPADRVKGVQK